MRSKRTQKLLEQLNRRVRCITFKDDTWMEISDSAKATYFGYEIRISFPNSPAEIKRDAECQPLFFLQLTQVYDQGPSDDAECEFFKHGFFTLTQAAAAINAYIRSKPYRILKKRPGVYALIDPIGRMVERDIPLARARALCDHNYTK